MGLFTYNPDYKKDRFDKAKYDNDYQKEHYDRITLLTPKGTKRRFKEMARARGVSVTQFCLIIVEDWIANNVSDEELARLESEGEDE